MSKNTNCLEGYKCPKCGQEDEILVRAFMWVSLTDEGTDACADGNVEYESTSDAECPECGFSGTLSDFMITEE